MELKDRFIGVLIGGALGDALGAPVEGLGRHEIAERFGRIEQMLDLGDHHGTAWRQPGLYTDDTQQALAVARVLITAGVFSPDLFIDTCLKLADAQSGGEPDLGALRGVGANFRRSLDEWRRGEPWNRSGLDSSGNGAALRVAPLGIFYRDDPQHLIRATIDCALPTHRRATGILAAVTQAQFTALLSTQQPGRVVVEDMVHELLRGGTRAWEVLAGEYAPYLIAPPKPDDPWMHVLKQLPEWTTKPVEAALEDIERNASATSLFSNIRATSGYAPASVALALVLSLAFIRDPREALIQAATLGGDTDTVGALTGAALGALHGKNAFPADWLAALHNRDMLIAYAQALYAAAQAIGPDDVLPDLIETEQHSTRQEQEQWRKRNSTAH